MGENKGNGCGEKGKERKMGNEERNRKKRKKMGRKRKGKWGCFGDEREKGKKEKISKIR